LKFVSSTTYSYTSILDNILRGVGEMLCYYSLLIDGLDILDQWSANVEYNSMPLLINDGCRSSY
ncbi:hypothetical protein HID58_001420, partial [Brassica napus]